MSATRDTVKHAAIYSAANMMGKLVGFIMLPFYAYALNAEGYGIIGMVEASIALLSSLLAYGFQSVLTRLYHEQPEERRPLAISTGYWIVFSLTGVMVGLAMIVSGPLATLLFGDAELNLILCLGLLAFFLDMCGQTAGTILVIRRRSMAFSALGLLRLVCGLSLNIAFIVVLDWGVFGYFLSAALTALLNFALFQHIAFRLCGTAFDSAIGREILRFQLPLVPSSLVSFASLQSERIMLRFIESIEKVGILEMGYKFPSLLALLIHTPLMDSWNTERIRIAQQGQPDAPRIIGDMATLSFYLLTLGALLIALCIGDLLVVLTPESFWSATRIAQIECVTIVIASITYHANFGFLYSKDSKGWARLMASTSALKIALSFLFINALGIMGAAYSALCSSVLLFVLATIAGQKRYRIEYRKGCNLLIVATAVTLFAAAEIFAKPLLSLAHAVAANIDTPLLDAARAFDASPRIVRVLEEKLPFLIDAGFRTAIGCGLLVLFPYVHPSARRWLQEKFGSKQPA